METYDNLWTLSWKPMAIVASETRGNPWTPNPWVSIGFHILWKHMETYGLLSCGGTLPPAAYRGDSPLTTHPWVIIFFFYGLLYGNPWQLLHRKLVETHGHHTNGFPWVSMGSGNPR